MSCSTCDGYEFVPNPDDPDGLLIDCPDCRAVDKRPRVWCPVHSTRVGEDWLCPVCVREAAKALRYLARRKAKEAA